MDRIMIRLSFILLATVCTCGLRGQEDTVRLVRDSLYLQGGEGSPSTINPVLSDEMKFYFPLSESERAVPVFTLPKREPDLRLPYQENPSPMFKGDFSTDGQMVRWRTGVLEANGSQHTLPSIGRMNEAAFTFQQELNDWLTLQAAVNMIKLNRAYFASQSFGLSGALVYRPQERLWFTAFGSVNAGNLPNWSPYGYGGTMGIGVTERFSIELGVRRYYDSVTRRWETRPVVMPGYRFNDKFKLEFDVGPILYDVIRSIVIDHRGGGGGPTIRPGVPGFR